MDIPHGIDTVDFRVTGTGHDRIERTYTEGCVNCRKIIGFNEKQPEHRIADWLCRHLLVRAVRHEGEGHDCWLRTGR